MSECRHLRRYFTSKMYLNLKNIHNLKKVSVEKSDAQSKLYHYLSICKQKRLGLPGEKCLYAISSWTNAISSWTNAISGSTNAISSSTYAINTSNTSRLLNSERLLLSRNYSTLLMGLISTKCSHHSICACCSDNLSNCRCDCEKSTRCFCAGPTHFHRVGITNQTRWFSSSHHKMSNKQLVGMDLLREPNVNKDLAFTTREREALNLKGLLPPCIRTQDLQVKIVMENIRQLTDDLAKYMLLRDLQDHNKRLFYRVLQLYTTELMPIVYTPIVGLACQKYSLIFKRPRGLYITVHDAGRVSSVLANWPEPDVKAIVVTDGERILGLGDLGANGMGIPVGKMALYSAIGGIPPELTLPVTIDVGTNNEALLADPYYIGIRQKRVTGNEYNHLIDEFMESVIKRWGRSCLIQFEDFGNANAFRLLEKYKTKYCTFNDDIQGTASVAVAGILASLKITGTKITQHTFLFQGAGEAALGTADLIVMAMEQEGMKTEDARSRIWMIDSNGLVTLNRNVKNDKHKMLYAKQAENTKNLEQIVDLVRPSCIIGVSAVSGAFTEAILKKMASISRKPIVFALSNPTSKAECTAEEAYRHTEGRCVFASGSPFDPVTINGKTLYPGQGNNAYIFPGVALAVMACGVHEIRDEVFLVAAKALADLVTQKDFDEGRVYPPLETINETSLRIASKVAQWFYTEGFASHRPEPDDKYLFLKGKLYDATYDGTAFEKHINGKSKWSTTNGNFTY